VGPGPGCPSAMKAFAVAAVSAVLVVSTLLFLHLAAGSHKPPEYGNAVQQEVVLGEVNIVVTTDIHSWITGRDHEPFLNVSLGHVTSFVEHLRELAAKQKKDVFFFDNGDINDGTALSGLASDHVEYLAPLMQAVPYDALNLGNHELYSRSHGLLPGNVTDCPVEGLRDSGYIKSWGPRYVTSNVAWANTGHAIGQRFHVVKGRFGTTLLVFGFLYNMEDACPAVVVHNVSEVVQEQWFEEALKSTDMDAVVVLAHMHFEDPLIDLIQAAIRRIRGPRMPVQFLAGHSHLRGWRRLDHAATVFEAGCKLDTVGFTSFSPTAGWTTPEGLVFNYMNLDGNTAEIAKATNVAEQDLLTPRGTDVLNKIVAQAKAIGADKVAGCATRRYNVSAPLGRADSLYAFYMNTVVPGTLFAGSDRPMMALSGSGTLIYDIYPGPLTVDDAYKASPFGNFWLVIQGVQGAHIVEALARLNKPQQTLPSSSMVVEPRPNMSELPSYMNSSTPQSQVDYDLIFCSFDMAAITGELKNVTGQKPNVSTYKLPQNTSSVLADWFFRDAPCPEQDAAQTLTV